MDLSAIEQRSR